MDRVAFFRDYVEKKPDDRFARYSLALELKKAGQLTEAEAELREVVRRHPTSGAAHLQLGQLLEEQDRLDDALAAFAAGLDALAGLHDADARKGQAELRLELEAVEDKLG